MMSPDYHVTVAIATYHSVSQALHVVGRYCMCVVCHIPTPSEATCTHIIQWHSFFFCRWPAEEDRGRKAWIKSSAGTEPSHCSPIPDAAPALRSRLVLVELQVFGDLLEAAQEELGGQASVLPVRKPGLRGEEERGRGEGKREETVKEPPSISIQYRCRCTTVDREIFILNKFHRYPTTMKIKKHEYFPTSNNKLHLWYAEATKMKI